jgi:hypothetical protein
MVRKASLWQWVGLCGVWSCDVLILSAQVAPPQPADRPLSSISATAHPSVAALVARLDLERYKATIKGLTQFGDRRQGTSRNRRAVDWIEAQLLSYGCPTERLQYSYTPPPPAPANPAPSSTDPNAVPRAVGGGRPRGVRTPPA